MHETETTNRSRSHNRGCIKPGALQTDEWAEGRDRDLYLKAVIGGQRAGIEVERSAAAHLTEPGSDAEYEGYRSFGEQITESITGHHRVAARLSQDDR